MICNNSRNLLDITTQAPDFQVPVNHLPSKALTKIISHLPKEDPTRLTFRASSRQFRELVPIVDAAPSLGVCEAAKRGYIAMLKWLTASNYLHDKHPSDDVLLTAIQQQQWPVLSWLGTTGLTWSIRSRQWNDKIYSVAQASVDTIRRWYGEYERYFPIKDCPLGLHAVEVAVRAKDFDGLKWLHTQFPNLSSSDTSILAAKEGNVAMLQWLKSHQKPINVQICQYAARVGHLPVLQWAHANQSPLEFRNCKGMIFSLDKMEPVDVAARGGHFECVQWLLDRNVAVTETTCHGAALGGNLEVVKILLEKRASWLGASCLNGFLYGDREVIGLVYNWLKSLPDEWQSDPNYLSFLQLAESIRQNGIVEKMD